MTISWEKEKDWFNQPTSREEKPANMWGAKKSRWLQAIERWQAQEKNFSWGVSEKGRNWIKANHGICL